MVPIGTLKVNFDTPTIQNKKTAIVKEKSALSLKFSGNYLKSPKAELPCAAVMNLGEWQDVGTTLVQDQKPLIKKSTIKCNYGGSTVEFVNSRQKNVPTVIDGKEKIKPQLEIEVLNNTFLPFGIKNFRDEKENDNIKFEIKCKKAKAENLTLNIKHNGNNIYSTQIEGTIGNGSSRIVEWDGFSDSRIYDSAIFINGSLKVEVSADGTIVEEKIRSSYKCVDWVDIKIDDNEKIIMVNLRVNLQDGGSNGLADSNLIPKSVILEIEKKPYTIRHKSFDELKYLSIYGINKFWSRNKSSNASIANGGVSINDNIYEVFVSSSATDTLAMPAPEITYWTNTKLNYFQENLFGVNRSRNWFMSRKLFYICGYYYIRSNKSWIFLNDNDAEFIETSAHEIGHEILTKYQGVENSIKHKGSSTLLQTPNGKYSYPDSGEIDIMKYVALDEAKPNDYANRVIAS